MKIKRYTEESLTFLIHRCHSKILKETSRQLSTHGLNLIQSLVLIAIYVENQIEKREYNLKDLLYTFDISKSSLAQIISKLEASNYLQRSIDQNDARRINILCTSKGKNIARKCIGNIDDIDKKLENLVGDTDDQYKTLQTLKKIKVNFHV
ncbi:MAG: hypothetical protein KAQ98_13705 [Bacteriovoracaceae bacterium]|nr:hypothetical protein [Bacteriovoracaceae bacterium]